MARQATQLKAKQEAEAKQKAAAQASAARWNAQVEAHKQQQANQASSARWNAQVEAHKQQQAAQASSARWNALVEAYKKEQAAQAQAAPKPKPNPAWQAVQHPATVSQQIWNKLPAEDKKAAAKGSHTPATAKVSTIQPTKSTPSTKTSNSPNNQQQPAAIVQVPSTTNNNTNAPTVFAADLSDAEVRAQIAAVGGNPNMDIKQARAIIHNARIASVVRAQQKANQERLEKLQENLAGLSSKLPQGELAVGTGALARQQAELARQQQAIANLPDLFAKLPQNELLAGTNLLAKLQAQQAEQERRQQAVANLPGLFARLPQDELLSGTNLLAKQQRMALANSLAAWKQQDMAETAEAVARRERSWWQNAVIDTANKWNKFDQTTGQVIRNLFNAGAAAYTNWILSKSNNGTQTSMANWKSVDMANTSEALARRERSWWQNAVVDTANWWNKFDQSVGQWVRDKFSSGTQAYANWMANPNRPWDLLNPNWRKKVYQQSSHNVNVGKDAISSGMNVLIRYWADAVKDGRTKDAERASQAIRGLPKDVYQAGMAQYGEALHGTLDAVGLIPGVGEIADGLNSLIYLSEGRRWEAGISAMAMLPIFGDLGKAGKWTVKVGSEIVEVTVEAGVKATLRAAAQEAAQEAVERVVREVVTETAEKATKELLQEAAEKAAAAALERGAKEAAQEAIALAIKEMGEDVQEDVIREAAERSLREYLASNAAQRAAKDAAQETAKRVSGAVRPPTKWDDIDDLIQHARKHATTPGERRKIVSIMTEKNKYIDMESHIVSTAHFANEIAKAMGKSDAERVLILRGAMLHDIGKNNRLIASLFNSPESFGPGIKGFLQKKATQLHVWSGFLELKRLGVDKEVVDFLRYHHPKYHFMPKPGSINESIQILTAADELSAGLVERTYRKSTFSPKEVLKWLEESKDKGHLTQEVYKAAKSLFE